MAHLGEAQGLPLDRAAAQNPVTCLNLADLERQAIETAMAQAEGHLPKAAELLGINRSTLWRKLKKSE